MVSEVAWFMWPKDIWICISRRSKLRPSIDHLAIVCLVLARMAKWSIDSLNLLRPLNITQLQLIMLHCCNPRRDAQTESYQRQDIWIWIFKFSFQRDYFKKVQFHPPCCSSSCCSAVLHARGDTGSESYCAGGAKLKWLLNVIYGLHFWISITFIPVHYREAMIKLLPSLWSSATQPQ